LKLNLPWPKKDKAKQSMILSSQETDKLVKIVEEEKLAEENNVSAQVEFPSLDGGSQEALGVEDYIQEEGLAD
jgi:hypothetical protein